jgi:hypothetical protein
VYFIHFTVFVCQSVGLPLFGLRNWRPILLCRVTYFVTLGLFYKICIILNNICKVNSFHYLIQAISHSSGIYTPLVFSIPCPVFEINSLWHPSDQVPRP